MMVLNRMVLNSIDVKQVPLQPLVLNRMVLNRMVLNRIDIKQGPGRAATPNSEDRWDEQLGTVPQPGHCKDR
jgi:hypothetical protein